MTVVPNGNARADMPATIGVCFTEVHGGKYIGICRVGTDQYQARPRRTHYDAMLAARTIAAQLRQLDHVVEATS